MMVWEILGKIYAVQMVVITIYVIHHIISEKIQEARRRAFFKAMWAFQEENPVPWPSKWLASEMDELE